MFVSICKHNQIKINLSPKWDDKYIDSLLGDHAKDYKLIQAQHEQIQRGHQQKMRRTQSEIDKNYILLNKSKSKFNENEYKSWTSEIVVLWIEHIENGLFGSKNQRNPSIKSFKKNVTENNICGSHLQELNDITLKVMGITDDKHRKLILNNIDRLIH